MADGEAAPASASARFDEFFSETIERHIRAEAAAGLIARRFRIAGTLVEMRFAGPALVRPLSAALDHLATDDAGKPDFTFHVYDEESTGFGPGRVQWELGREYPHGEVLSLIDGNRYLQVRQPRQQVLAGRRLSGQAIVWLSSFKNVAAWEWAAPLLTLFNWWASAAGYFYVHAGAVGRREGGVLVLGPSGAGKSHTALACLESDLVYASDDLCLLGTRGPAEAVGLYSTAKLYHFDVPQFPFLRERREQALLTHEGKCVFFMNDILPERMSAGFPIKAIVLPSPSGRPGTTWSPASPAAAFFATGPLSALRWPSIGRLAFKGLAGTLRSLPCYRIETGTDLATIPRTISGLLDSLN